MRDAGAVHGHGAEGVAVQAASGATEKELRLVSVLAARRANASERETHSEVAQQLRHAGRDRDTLLYLRLHFALKRLTAFAARNPFAESAISPLQALSRRFCERGLNAIIMFMVKS